MLRLMKKVILLILFAIGSTQAQNGGEMVSFKGKIANRNSDSIVVTGENFAKTIKLNKRGVFEDTFEIPSTGLFQFFDGSERSLLFLKNGYKLELAMDAKQFDESIVYKGNGAKENNYLVKKALADEEFQNELGFFFTEDEKTFADGLQIRKDRTLSALNEASIDEELAKIVTATSEQETMMLTQQYKKKLEINKMNGKPSPSFSYENHKGGVAKLEDFKGKYVYIDVWATWCGPCRAEIPHLKKVEEMFKDKNIVFLSISVDKKKDYDKWKQFVSEKQLGGVQLLASEDKSPSSFMNIYGVDSIPRFILLDREGNVIFADAPRPSSKALTSTLGELLN